MEIIDRAWDEGWVTPQVPTVQDRQAGRRHRLRARPGLAAAQQLTRAGHDVVVLERADRIGGLLRYGIPEFKMEKRHLDRRIAQMEAEGTEFRTNATVGDDVDIEVLLASYDAVVLACGATAWRDLPVPGRELAGIHQAMEYLPLGQPGAAGRHRRVADRRRTASTSSSSAAATPAPTASAPRTARARRRSPSWRSCRSRPTPRAASNPWPQFAHDVTRSPRPTRRAASGCTASTPSASSTTATATCARC